MTEVYSFSLDGVPPEWSGPLVLRVFGDGTDPKAVRRECIAQEVVAAQGAPAPRVLASEDTFMIMELLPGRPQMVIEFPALLLQVPRLVTLPRRHAGAMNMVHSLDATPLLEAFALYGIDGRLSHWLDGAERTIDRWGFEGLRPALAWFRTNQPDEPQPPSICHGDLFGANILEKRGKVTGIIDWNLVTVADPAFDIGGQLAAYEMSATPGPRVLQALTIGFGRLLAWGFRGANKRYRRVPKDVLRYYSSLRAFTEMTFKLGALAEIELTGVPKRLPTWNPAQCARYIRRRTGVDVRI